MAVGAPTSPEAPVAPPSNEPVIILVIGIVSIWLCQPLGAISWYLGWAYNRRMRALGYRDDPIATVGMVLGMVGMFLFILSFLMVFIVFAIYFVLVLLAVVLSLVGAAASATPPTGF